MEVTIKDEAHMSEFGTRLGSLLQGGELFELIGDVGAGKTTLTKGLGRGLTVTSPIQSPTFTISNRYAGRDGLTLAHYDFYRLHDAGIMQDELVEVIGDETIVTVVEWGDIVAGVLPDDRITITITPLSEVARQLAITTRTSEAQKLLEKALR